MNTNGTNVTSTWVRIETNFHVIAEYFITPILCVIVFVAYLSCIVGMSVRIKNRRRKLKQLKCSNVRLTFEEEEKLKWDVYNENTFLVKEIYLILICVCEVSYITLPLVFNSIPILLEKITFISNVGKVGVFQRIPGEIRCKYYNYSIIMIEKGFFSVLLHWNILLVPALMRYLTSRYLLRKSSKQLSLISYGVVTSLIIVLFYNKYAYHFRIILHIITLVDWIILVRCGRKLSLVLIGRVREIQQCYGNGIMYRNQYNNYLSFRVFHFIICSGILLVLLGTFSSSATSMQFMDDYVCGIQGFSIHFHKIQEIELALKIIRRISKLIIPIGIIVFYTPAFVYLFSVIIRFCAARCKKRNFQDELIRPLIDRYHDRIMH